MQLGSSSRFPKPPHERYVLRCLDEKTYSQYACLYGGCKRFGVRGIYAFLTGTELWGVAKEFAKGTVVQYGKRRIATVVIGGAAYICAPAVAVLTNTTKVVKTCKVVYTGIGYIAEAVEDASHVPFLPLDILFFGQPIPANMEGRFSNWSNITDLIDNLPSGNE